MALPGIVLGITAVTQGANIAAPVGPYSPAVKTGAMIFCSGQIPLDPVSGAIVAGGIKEQTEQVMKNIQSLLKASGAGFADIVKTTIFLKSMGDFATVNEIYGKYFTAPFPARSTVEVARLPKDVLIEIEVTALQPQR